MRVERRSEWVESRRQAQKRLTAMCLSPISTVEHQRCRNRYYIYCHRIQHVPPSNFISALLPPDDNHGIFSSLPTPPTKMKSTLAWYDTTTAVASSSQPWHRKHLQPLQFAVNGEKLPINPAKKRVDLSDVYPKNQHKTQYPPTPMI